MLEKEGLDQILHFVSKRWVDLSRDVQNPAFAKLPTNFWMNSIGGNAGVGRWITTILYTEDETEAESFKQVLLRWQSKQTKSEFSDLIQLGKK